MIATGRPRRGGRRR